MQHSGDDDDDNDNNNNNSNKMSSSCSYSSCITGEDLKSFHWIDREIFSRLVINLGRDIEDSIRVIGFWLWLEEMGSPNLIFRFQSSLDFIINVVFNEALHFLNRLHVKEGEADDDINMGFTLGLLNSAALSPRFFSDKKVSVLRSVNRFVTDVAPRTFDDIINQAHVQRAQILGGLNRVGPIGGGGDQTGYLGLMCPSPSMSLKEPLIPSPMGFVVGGPSGSGSNPMAVQPPNPVDLHATPNDRTLFVTFSRGYPITDRELIEFFTRSFGDCIEGIYLQRDTEKPYGQALFALVVVRSATLLDLILEGADDGKVKFVINGKHARARKYLTKGST